jgi:hypothetical protein
VYIVLPRTLFVPVLAIACLSLVAPQSDAQGLPSTNFGKFVHQPGDNQYEEKAQRERHSPPPAVRSAAPAGGGGFALGGAPQGKPAWVPTPPPRLPDISLLPIVTDEPIKPAGFPPMPDRPELPVTSAWARAAQVAGAAGNAAPSQDQNNTGGGGFNRRVQGTHEHYEHYMPGACIKQNQPAPGGQQGAPSQQYSASNQQSGGNAGGSHGYYKVGTPDVYNVNTGGGSQPKDREPRLNAKLDTIQRPDAPTPVVVSQSTTQPISSQDLSLPDDDYNAQSPSTRNTKGKRVSQGIQRAGTRVLYGASSQLLNGGGGMLRFH